MKPEIRVLRLLMILGVAVSITPGLPGPAWSQEDATEADRSENEAVSREATQAPSQADRMLRLQRVIEADTEKLAEIQDDLKGREDFFNYLSEQLEQGEQDLADMKQRLEEKQSPAAVGTLPGIDPSLSPGEQHARPALPTEYVAPRNEKERIFATIWQEVLGIDQVGIYDNFFDLGGASLQSIQVVARAKEAGIEITPEMIFEFPTIAELTG